MSVAVNYFITWNPECKNRVSERGREHFKCRLQCVCVCIGSAQPCLTWHGMQVFSCLHNFLWGSHLARSEDQCTVWGLGAPAATVTKTVLELPGRRTPSLPLAHCGATLLGSLFVTASLHSTSAKKHNKTKVTHQLFIFSSQLLCSFHRTGFWMHLLRSVKSWKFFF